MAFCGKCGAQLAEGATFCNSCGEKINAVPPQAAQPQQPPQVAYTQPQQPPQAAYTQPQQPPQAPYPQYQQAPREGAGNNSKLYSILAYIGPLWLVGLLVSPENKDPRVRFHVNQGIVLFGLWVAYIIVSSLLSLIKVTAYYSMMGYSVPIGRATPWWISLICWLLALGVTALAVLGIVNVVNGKDKELPIIGKIRILK